MALAVLESAASIFARDVTQVDPEIQDRNWAHVHTSILHREYVGTDGTSAFENYEFPEVETDDDE